MSLLGDRFRDHRMNDPVPGRALVVEVNDWLLETRTPYTLRATLVVEASGVPRTTVAHTELVDAAGGTHLDKWPDQGATVPVVVDRADPTRVRIEWDVMPGKAERLRDAAQETGAVRAQELLAQAYGTATPAVDPGRTGGEGCRSCGAANAVGTAFCRSCGARLT